MGCRYQCGTLPVAFLLVGSARHLEIKIFYCVFIKGAFLQSLSMMRTCLMGNSQTERQSHVEREGETGRETNRER